MNTFNPCDYPGCQSLAAATVEINVDFLYVGRTEWGPAPKVCEFHYDLLRADLDGVMDWCEEPLPLLDEEEGTDSWGVGA